MLFGNGIKSYLIVLAGSGMAAGLFSACFQSEPASAPVDSEKVVEKEVYVPEIIQDEKTGLDYIKDKETGQLYLYGGIRRRLGEAEDGALGKVSSRTLKSVQTDWSGKVQTAIWECSTINRAEIQTLSCPVDPDWVLIGGGARTQYFGSGALLTEARPHDQGLASFTGASKAHKSSDPHHLYVYAIGLKLVGIDRQTLYNHMIYKESAWSELSEKPANGNHWSGYTSLSGGARIEWTHPGNMLTHSAPFGGPDGHPRGWSWLAYGKSHKSSSPARIKSYLIGINQDFGVWGQVQSQLVESPRVTGSGFQSATRRVTPGWVMAGVGGYTDNFIIESGFSGSGRLLTGIYPDPADPTVGVVTSKDHLTGSSGSTIAFIIALRKK